MKSLIVAGLILGAVLVSGKVDINVEHSFHPPKTLGSQTEIFIKRFVSASYPFIHKKMDIYLINKVQDMGVYADLSNALSTLNKGDEVYFHIAGYGGSYFGYQTIRAAILRTEAHVTMLVEGPALSGHAYLALINGVTLKMNKGTYLMVHRSSIMNEDCTKMTGLDRGIPLSDKCEATKEVQTRSENYILSTMPYLTANERARIDKGEDVYIYSDDIENRQHGLYIERPGKLSKDINLKLVPSDAKSYFPIIK